MSSPEILADGDARSNASATKAAPSGKPRSATAKRVEPISREAQRMAAAILEVLAGVRTPAAAAQALGITVPRYYVWEQRALAGLVSGCEPQAAGGTSPRWRIAMLEKEVARLKQQCARQEALARAAQRTIGLAPPAASKPPAKTAAKGGAKPGGQKSRKRRPAVRALKAAAAVRATPVADTPAPPNCSGAVSPEVLQPCAMSRNPLPTAACGAGVSPASRSTDVPPAQVADG